MDKVYELKIDGENELDGVHLISFVESPAIEEDFFYFSKIEEKYRFSDTDKHIVTGPTMIPNRQIYRRSDSGEEFNVFFSEETIIKCNELFFKRNQHQNTNIDHNELTMDGVTVIESWIIEDPKNDKSNSLGFTDLPKGTWMTSWKVDNIELWNKIKDENGPKGFSIEGNFIKDLIKMSEQSEDEILQAEYDKIENIIRNSDLTEEEAYDLLDDMLGEQ